MKTRTIFERLAAAGQTLENSLATAEAVGQQYGPQAVDMERSRALKIWRDSALEMIHNQLRPDIEALRTESAAATAALLDTIAGGGPARKPTYGTDLNPGETALVRAIERNSDATLQVARAAKLQANLALAQLTRTPVLVQRMRDYLEAAERAPEFDYEAFSLDRITIPAVLEARAANGDGEAQIVLENGHASPARVEQALVSRAGIEVTSDGDVREFEYIADLVKNLDPSAPPFRGLAELQDALGRIGRLMSIEPVQVTKRLPQPPRMRSQAATNPDWVAGAVR